MSESNKTKTLKFFHRIDRSLFLIESVILVFSLGIMIIMAFLQVIMRNFFSFSILWWDPLLRHMVLWVGFLGASMATRENRHISIDALYRLLRPSWKRWALFVTNLFSALISGLLVRAAYVFVRDERAAGSTLFLDIQLWPFVSIILIGFIIVTFRFIVKAFLPSHTNHPVSGE